MLLAQSPEERRREQRIQQETRQSRYSNSILLSHERLLVVPASIFSLEWIQNIRRLDLSFNCISVVPNSITALNHLKELWLQGNPILRFPDNINNLQYLELIDIRGTKISIIPPELSLVKSLYAMDWRDTPAEDHYLSRYSVIANDLIALLSVLDNTHRRCGLERQLLISLSEEHFAKEADKPGIGAFIEGLVNTLSEMFTDIEDFRIFVKRASNLLPEYSKDISPISLRKVRENYIAMQRDTLRKRLSADVEIKLRAVYFDRIERQDVENIINSIYQHVLSLEDIQFFVKYASQVLPTTPQQCSGEIVWSNILALQADLTNKRNAAIESLAGVMTQMYPEQEPHLLQSMAASVARTFAQDRFATKRELTNLSRLTADASKIFPPDFASVEPNEIHTVAIAQFTRKTI